MINWFDMPAEGLSNGGLFEVKELEVTENGTYETKGEMYNKVTVNVEGGGGGGSSDFSTATLTINFTGDNAKVGENAYFDIYAPSTLYANGGYPYAFGTDDDFGVTPYAPFGSDEIKQGQIVVPVVLYKGSALWATQIDGISYSWDNSNLSEPDGFVLSGQISHNNEWSDGLYKIAGDCAVTIRLLDPRT